MPIKFLCEKFEKRVEKCSAKNEVTGDAIIHEMLMFS